MLVLELIPVIKGMSKTSFVDQANAFAQSNLKQGSALIGTLGQITSQASGLADCKAKLS